MTDSRRSPLPHALLEWAAMVLVGASAVEPGSPAQRIAERTFPSVFQAWSAADNLTEDPAITLARHDLVFHGERFFGLQWNAEHQGLATGFTPESLEQGRARRRDLLSRNPHLIMLMEIRYRDAWGDVPPATCPEEFKKSWRGFLPPDHAWWKRGGDGTILPGWKEGGFLLLDFANPGYRDQVANQCAAAVASGVVDGIMLDWWEDDADRLALATAIRKRIGPEALILVNSNDRTIPRTAPFVNGLYMECYRSGTAEEWHQIAGTLAWAETNLRPPRINCLESWYYASRADEHLMRAITTLSLTQSDGYCLFGDPNPLPTPDHLHDWYSFWERSLGKATGPGVARTDGARTREFSHGTAVYNPMGNQPVTIRFDEPRTSRATGQRTRTHTLAACDGDLYIRTGDAPRSEEEKGASTVVFPVPAPRIDPPKPKLELILSVADFGAKPDDEASDWRAFVAALAACKQRGASVLVIPKGRYRFQDSAALERPDGHILLEGISDLTIDGQGSELVFHHIRAGFQFRNCQRILVKNLTVDWDIRLASAAVAAEEPGVGKVLRVLDGFPITADTPIGTMSAVSEYDLGAHRWVIGGQECYNPDNVKQIRPQVFAAPAFAGLSIGKTFVIRHYVYSAHAFDFGGPGNADLAFEDITVFASPGHNWVGYGCERGFRLSRCRIARRDAPDRLISGASDGAHFGATRGDILVEDCDFSMMGDDSINIHGAWMRTAQKPSGRTLRLKSRWFYAALIDPGEELKLCHAANLEEYGRCKVVAVTRDDKAQTLSVTVDRDLPTAAAQDDYVANLSRSSPNFIFRRNYFHDHRARGMLIQARGGLIEGNRISRVMAAAIQMTTDANFWQEGYGCEDITVRQNVIEGCNYAGWERGPTGRHMGCVNLLVDTAKGLGAYPVHRNVVIEDNTITDTPGLAVLVSSAQGVVIRNNRITDSNTQPFNGAGSAIDATAAGSIMVTRSADVTVTGNRFSGKTVPLQPICIDPRNTRNVAYTAPE